MLTNTLRGSSKSAGSCRRGGNLAPDDLEDVIHGPRRAEIEEWAKRQVYIALGNFLTCAAMLGIDTCPLEGIEPQKYDEILGLPARGLATVVVGVAGYRAADDKYATLAKVRFKSEDVIVRL